MEWQAVDNDELLGAEEDGEAQYTGSEVRPEEGFVCTYVCKKDKHVTQLWLLLTVY